MVRPDGRRGGAPALRDGSLCFWHEPEKADEVADARKLGGLRRRRERTVAVAYDLAGLDSVESIRRVVEIALFDALGLDNSIARARVLIAGTRTSTTTCKKPTYAACRAAGHCGPLTSLITTVGRQRRELQNSEWPRAEQTRRCVYRHPAAIAIGTSVQGNPTKVVSVTVWSLGTF